MAEATAKFAAISPGMTTDQASEGLISIMKAWQGEIKVSDIETVMDKINTLGNKFAEENDDVLDGMQQAASALSAMGTSYTDAFALFTGAQEILQDADKVGNGLKSVAMRIRGYSEDVETGAYVVDESLSTISGDLIELTKIDGKLPEGISIYTEDTKNKLNDADKKYKSLVEYLREIAKYWNDFSETQQTQLLNKLFAKTQANVGAALITNWESVEKALTEMENSAGSADAEMSKVEETITFKLNELKETWTGFIQDFIPRELIVDAISALTDLSEAITSVLSIGGAREVAIAATVAAIKKIYSVAILGMVNLKKEAVNKKANVSDVIIGGIQSAINQSGSSVKQSSTVNSVNAATNHLTNIKKIADAQQNLNKGVSVYIPTQNSATIAMGKATSEMANAGKEATGLKSKIGSLKESFSGLSLISKIQIAAGVAAIGYGIYSYVKTQHEKAIQEAKQAAENVISTYNEQSSAVKETANSINEIKDEYFNLSKGVDKFGNNVSLTTDEFDRYNELSNQIGDYMPTLIQGWTDQGDAILMCKDNTKALTQALKENEEQAYNNFVRNVDEDGNVTNGFDVVADNYNNQKSELDSQKDNIADLIAMMEEFESHLEELRSAYNLGDNASLQNIYDILDVNGDRAVFRELDNEIDSIMMAASAAGISISDSFNNGLGTSFNDLSDGITLMTSQAHASVRAIDEDINDLLSDTKNAFTVALANPDLNLQDDESSLLKQIIGNLNPDDIEGWSGSQIEAFVKETLELIRSNGDVKEAISNFYTPDESQTVSNAKKLVDTYKDAVVRSLNDVSADMSRNTADALFGQINNSDVSTYVERFGATVAEVFKTADNYDAGVDTLALANVNQYSKQLEVLQGQLAQYEADLEQANKDLEALNLQPLMEGNVDLNHRGIYVNEGSDSYETILGSSGTFFGWDEETQTEVPWIVRYTPLLQNADGSVTELTDDTVNDYINEILSTSGSVEEAMEKDAGRYKLFFEIETVDSAGNPLNWDSLESIWGGSDSAQYYDADHGWVIDFELPDGSDYTYEDAREYIKNILSEAVTADDVVGSNDIVLNVRTVDENGNPFDKNVLKTLYNDEVKDQTNHENQAALYGDVGENLVGLEQTKSRIEEVSAALADAQQQLDRTSSSEEIAEQKLREYYNSLNVSDSDDFTAFLRENYNDLDMTLEVVEKVITAFEEYKNVSTTSISSPVSLDASTLSTVATQLSTIHSAYTSLQEDIANGKVGTELARSMKDVESLRESFTELGDAADFGDYGSFDAIENVLTSGKASADEMLDAYNQLATTYATAKLAAADYSEEAQAAISTQLQLAGVTKESADAFVASITAEAQAKQMVAGIDLSAMTKDELNAFLDEADAATITKEAVYLLWLQEYQMNNSSLDTTSQCQAVLDIADAAGVSITSLTVLQNRMAAIGALEEYKSGSNINIVDLRRLENEVDKWSSSDAYDQVFSEFENQVSGKKIDFSSRSGSGSSGGSGSSSDAKDEYLDKFKEQYDELKELRDNDQIDEYEYVQYLRALYQKYFKNKKKYIKEYAQYEREYLSGMKSLYESVFSALTSRIDKEIDRLNTAKEAATKALEAQKSAAVSSLQKQKAAAVAAIDAQIDALEDEIDAIDDEIDAYQDEIDAINDANEARERELALQQALYDLDKLQGQRTNLVYSESQGMHYEADTSGIRDARESVQDAKDDIEIANIEKKIELLEKQKELIEDQIEELEEEKEAIEAYYDGLIEETEAYYDNLIAQSEAYYDSQINNLENSKTMIEELMDVWENAQMDKILKEMGISFDELVEKIKGGDFSALDEIFTGYSSVLKEMASGSDSLTESLGRLLNQDMSTIPNFLQETAAAFEGVENVNLDLVNEGLETFKQNLESLPNSDAVKQMFGENLSDSFNQGLSEVETGLNQFLASDTVTGFAERFASTLDLTNKDGELITAFKSIGTNSSEGYAEGLADESAKENVNAAVDDLTGIDDDSSSQGAAGRARDNVQTHSPSEVFKKIGEYCGQGLALGLSEAMNDPEVTGQIDQAMETFVEKIQTAIQQIDFSAMLDSMGANGEDDVGFFEGMLTGIQSFIEELGNLDITPIATLVEQFTTLKQTISDVSMAISGGGMSEDSEGGESQGGGGSSGGGKSGSSGGKSGGKSQSSGEGGSLVEALQTLGSTSEEVIGSAEDEEGGSGESEGTGMIGQFKNLKTAVQDVTASIGTDETGEGGESGGGEGGEDGESTTLIGAMNTLSEVALNEETGIPKHIDLWHKMNDSIHEAAESLHEFRSELEELVGVTWECHVFKEYAEGSGSSADGTAAKAVGTVNGLGYAYARGKNIGLESDQRALIGEVGYEGLVVLL